MEVGVRPWDRKAGEVDLQQYLQLVLDQTSSLALAHSRRVEPELELECEVEYKLEVQ